MTLAKWRPARLPALGGGFALLFAVYQLPQGIHDYVYPNRLVWLLLTAIFFAAAAAVARGVFRGGMAVYGLHRHPGWARRAAFGVTCGLSVGVAAEIVRWRAGLFTITAVNGPAVFLSAAVPLAFGSLLASAAEDILTRGYLFASHRWPPAALTLVSATVFVLNHIYVLSRGPALWTFLWVLGLALAWPLARTGSLWFTIGAHWGWNLVYHWSPALLVTRGEPAGNLGTWISAAGAAALLVLVIAFVPGNGAQGGEWAGRSQAPPGPRRSDLTLY